MLVLPDLFLDFAAVHVWMREEVINDRRNTILEEA
jgi:hypothetical protein